MASIDKRPNGRYRTRWREYPGGRQKTRHFDRNGDAQQFLDGARGDLAHGLYIDPVLRVDRYSSPAQSTRDLYASSAVAPWRHIVKLTREVPAPQPRRTRSFPGVSGDLTLWESAQPASSQVPPRWAQPPKLAATLCGARHEPSLRQPSALRAGRASP